MAHVGDLPQAQDLTAQTFLAALQRIASYRGTGEFLAWLLSIARHKTIDYLRSRRANVSLEAAAEIPSSAPSPEQVVISRLQLKQVVRALRRLAPERAEVLALRILGGLSIAEVAVLLGKSETACKVLLRRALHDLRARLASGSEVVL